VRPGDAAGVNRTATYDRYGRVLSTTDRRGTSISYAYDARDRLTGVTTPQGTTTQAYGPDHPNGAPRWIAVSNAVSTDTVMFDAEGRTTRTATLRPIAGVGTVKYEVASTYDVYGGRDTLQYRVNGGAWRAARTVRDIRGRTRSITDFTGASTTLTYNGEGSLIQAAMPGQTAAFGYTANHLPSTISYSSSTALDLHAGMHLTYDDANRLASRAWNDERTWREFGYDGAGQLRTHRDLSQSTVRGGCYNDVDDGWICTSSTTSTVTAQRTYAFDRAGNPTDLGAVVAAGNRLQAYNGWTLEYDGEGNLTRKYNASQNFVYTWNALGQLEQVRLNGAVTATYGYDGLGRRVRRAGAAATEHYLYDGDDLLLDLNGTGGVAAEYRYYDGIDRPLSMVRGSARYSFAIDPQGSVLAVVDGTGAPVNRYRYSPFGVAETATETVVNRLRYAGREWDADAGMYYLRNRWYDPALQRFASEDPIGVEGGLNLYAYTGNNPVNATDPTGLMPSCYEITSEMPGGNRASATFCEEAEWAFSLRGMLMLWRMRSTSCTWDCPPGFTPGTHPGSYAQRAPRPHGRGALECLSDVNDKALANAKDGAIGGAVVGAVWGGWAGARIGAGVGGTAGGAIATAVSAPTFIAAPIAAVVGTSAGTAGGAWAGGIVGTHMGAGGGAVGGAVTGYLGTWSAAVGVSAWRLVTGQNLCPV
jgi:RHS repeat-associated protein